MTARVASPAPILVTGANGNVGRSVVESLLCEGHPVRALVTDPSAAAFTCKPADDALLRFVRFDFSEPSTFARVFVGVMVALYSTARLGLADHLSPDLALLLGKAPTTLSAFAEASVEVWRE